MSACAFEKIFHEASFQKLVDSLSVSLQVNIGLCQDVGALTGDDILIMLGEEPVAGFVVKELHDLSGKPLSEKLKNVKNTLFSLASQLSELAYDNLYLKSLVNSLEGQEVLHQKEREVLEALAERDSLTGLYNRRKFEETLSAYAKDGAQHICIISADTNYLKLTNDIFGHDNGDIMLKRVAEILQKLARPGWVVARCGGDEFRVLLPDSSLVSATDYCKRVFQNCKNEKSLAFPLSVAMGAAEWDCKNETLAECFARADEKMYENKAALKRSQQLPDFILERLFDRQFLNEDVINCSVKLSQEFARYLELPAEQIKKVGLAARYEDIGMAQLPESFMIRGLSQTPEEKALLESHVKRGYDMARQFEELYQIADIILCCHENWAGNSYPRRLKGYQIPLEARIIRIVNNYSYWVVPTTFGTNLSPEDARKRLISRSGDMYDPELISKFLRFLNENKY